MSRNRLAELQPATNPNESYQNNDLERNEPIGGPQYELQDRSPRQLDLNEFLDEVGFFGTS